MNILVIDDNPINRESAYQTIKGHRLTVVGTYDEAYRLLEVPYVARSQEVHDAIRSELERRHGPLEKEWEAMTRDEQSDWLIRFERIAHDMERPIGFDVVLCDLLMPASKRMMAERTMSFVGQEMPVGFGLLLMALMKKVRYAAIVTDTGHHDHPTAAMLDPFLSRCPSERNNVGTPSRFIMNGARVGVYTAPMRHVDGTTCINCRGSGRQDPCHCVEQNGGVAKADCDTCAGVGTYCWPCEGSGKRWGKDWSLVLKNLTLE